MAAAKHSSHTLFAMLESRSWIKGDLRQHGKPQGCVIFEWGGCCWIKGSKNGFVTNPCEATNPFLSVFQLPSLLAEERSSASGSVGARAKT